MILSDFGKEFDGFKSKVKDFMAKKDEEVAASLALNRCKHCPLCLQGFTGELADSKAIIESLRKSLSDKDEKLKHWEQYV